jgi:hypothetical protein
MSLPDTRLRLLAPLFEVLPLEDAMPELLPKRTASAQAVAVVKQLLASEALRRNPAAQSALWLYVDELDRSHSISQSLHTPTGSWLHGIMHRREGDFWNSHYWMRQARKHPAWEDIPGYDPDEFIDAVSAANGQNPPELLVLQRAEWVGLMAHCLA